MLVVSDRGRVLRLPLAEVLYLKAELKYVTLRTAEHSYVLDETLTELEQRLGDAFMRMHRNALVARGGARAAAPTRCMAARRGPMPSGWAVRWRRWTNGWRCRAARWRRCARRWPAARA